MITTRAFWHHPHDKPYGKRAGVTSLLRHIQVVMSGGRAVQSFEKGGGAVSHAKPAIAGCWCGTFAVVAVGAVLTAVTIVSLILHLTVAVGSVAVSRTRVRDAVRGETGGSGIVPMLRAARSIAPVTAVAIVVFVTVTAFLLARRVVAGAAARRRSSATAGRPSRRATVTVTTGVEAPGGRRRSASPLDVPLVDVESGAVQ